MCWLQLKSGTRMTAMYAQPVRPWRIRGFKVKQGKVARSRHISHKNWHIQQTYVYAAFSCV